MASKCRAADSNTCRVHGTGSMYESLQAKATEAINKRDFNSYREIRWEMDEMADDSKAALKFFERGGVPTLAQRVGGKMNAFADRIIESRDNINEAVVGLVEGTEKPEKEKTTKPDDSYTLKERLEEGMDNTFDRAEGLKNNIGGTISEGVDRITDRHESPIPAEIGGGTMAWSDLNPFKNPFKNGKLR